MIELHLQRSLKKRLKPPKKPAAEGNAGKSETRPHSILDSVLSPINHGAFSNQSRASLPRADQRGLPACVTAGLPKNPARGNHRRSRSRKHHPNQ
jgi:hypothetical protein